MIEWLSLRLLVFVLLGLVGLVPCQAAASVEAGREASLQADTAGAQLTPEAVIQQFAEDIEVAPERRIETERKHQILFIMGISLLLMLFLTGSLGVAMVAFDKDVFVAHMIVAGLSLTLAAVHAATSIAWFWPF